MELDDIVFRACELALDEGTSKKFDSGNVLSNAYKGLKYDIKNNADDYLRLAIFTGVIYCALC
ncbi:MAG: hypothetical protein AABX08_03215 [Nanoarchaeota archaeon]